MFDRTIAQYMLETTYDDVVSRLSAKHKIKRGIVAEPTYMRKQCKSCKYLHIDKGGINCVYNPFTNPTDKACEYYQSKRK